MSRYLYGKPCTRSRFHIYANRCKIVRNRIWLFESITSRNILLLWYRYFSSKSYVVFADLTNWKFSCVQKSWSINHEGETQWKGVVFSSFPRLKSRAIFVRAHTDAGKCSALCKPSKFIFANKCSVTVEISDWSAEAGKRGKARQGNVKREITANRMRKRRRGVRKGLRASAAESLFSHISMRSSAQPSRGRKNGKEDRDAVLRVIPYPREKRNPRQVRGNCPTWTITVKFQ